jgi:hypothetical protein
MIIYVIPYRTDKNLGKAYNDIMRLVNDDDCVCFHDGDTSFLTPDFGTIIESYHERFPDAVLTCKTNRIHPLSKQLDGHMDEKCDMRELMKKADHYRERQTVTPINVNEGMSGVLMLVPKRLWKEVPFAETKKALGVDTQFRIDLHRAGKKILIMDAVLIFHGYRLLQGSHYKEHLS